MNTFLEQWTTALRSGEYKQGHNYLRTEDGGFCCLGVAADLLCKAEPQKYGWEGQRFFAGGKGGWVGTLSDAVADIPLGAWLSENDRQEKLIQANDNGKTFAEIADMIDSMRNEGP